MEIKKSYELRQVGPKIVLLMMNAPDYQLKARLCADETVSRYHGVVVPEKVGSDQFFVLRNGETFSLCWEKHNTLEFIEGCTDFRVLEDTLLFEKDNLWYWWISAASAEQKHPLGIDLNLLGNAFILSDKNAYLFIYFEDGAHMKCKRCLSYEVLSPELLSNSFLHEELFPDVLKIITADEGALYVSIKKKKGPVYHHMYGADAGKVSFFFEFAEAPATALINFTKFANDTCQAFLDKGFSVAMLSPTQQFFDYHTMAGKMSEDVKAFIGAALSQPFGTDVNIEVNLSKLYRKEKGVYLVKCETLGYYKTADEVRLDNAKNALFVMADGVTDKIYAKGNHPLSAHPLGLMTKV